MRFSPKSLALPGLIGVALCSLATVYHGHELELAKDRWSLAVAAETRDVEERLFDVFHALYTGLRTIARLPGVRAISRHGENFDANARRTIQEIYNNLATDVAMSEVYLVPADLDPDAIDPATGRPQEPIMTFDELIVGRSADGDAHAASGGAEAVEEVEIFEYRAMRAQLARLRELCPTENSVRGLDYPALSSPEVVTCDNRYYSARDRDDSARSGIVYSVPVFGDDGALRGMVSGVLLTRMLRECLPTGCYALVNAHHDFVAGSLTPGVWSEHRREIGAEVPAADLAWSSVQRLRVVDSDATWRLWAGRPNAEFAASVEASQAFTAYALLLVACIGITVVLAFREHARRSRREQERQRLAEMRQSRDAAESLSLARRNLIAVASQEIRTPLGGLLSMTDVLLRSQLQAEQRTVVESVRQSTSVLVDLLQGILDYSALEAGELQLERGEFDLHELLEKVLELMAPAIAGKPVDLVLLIGEDLPARVIGDRGRLSQVLISLVGNAVKFTNQGVVSVHAEVFATGDGPMFCLRVGDTGVGIDPAVRARLFEPFTQGARQGQGGGIGLGLATSRRLVEGMGGSLDVMPVSGSGTTMVVTMPLQLPTIRQSSAPPLQGRRVAVVLESVRRAAMVAGDLAAAGAEVVRIDARDEALARIRAQQDCHVVIVDGADSAAAQGLAEWIAESQAAIGLVVAEGWQRPIADRAKLAAAVREVVRLPLGRRALTAAVQRALVAGSRPGPAPEVARRAEPAAARSVELVAADAAAAKEPAPSARKVADANANANASAAAGAAASAVARAADPVGTPGGNSVLIVDPREASAVVLGAALRRLGRTSTAARDAQQAIAAVRGGDFGAVFVDVSGSPDGPSLVLELRRELAARPARSARLCAIVERDAGGVGERLAAAGITVLTRPVRAAALAAVLGDAESAS